MTNEFIFHPGEYIAEELEARGWTQKQFAEIIKKTPAEVNHVITGRRDINADRAMRLSMAFGTSPDLWMRLQAKYDLQMLENSPENQNIFKGIKKTAVGYHTLEVV